MGMDGQIDTWSHLATEAAAGRLKLDADIARDLDMACDKRLADLRKMLTRAVNLQSISGFGDLPSGNALERKFRAKAAGDEMSLDAVLKQHIQVVTDMQTVFRSTLAGYQETDTSTADTFGTIQP